MGKVKRGAATADLTHLVELVLMQLTTMYEVLERNEGNPFLNPINKQQAIDSMEAVGNLCHMTAQEFRGSDEWT
tara:strand:+ start:1325 stop:1546 length:222 start_codon:yes stop_codon:yes gene_type:complete